MRAIDADERRARLGHRQLLASSAKVDDPVEVSRAVVAVHATDPASVFLGIRARMGGVSVAAIESALYDARSIVRMLGMRRTMFVVPTGDVALVHAAATRAIAARERKRTGQMIEGGGLTDDASALLRRRRGGRPGGAREAGRGARRRDRPRTCPSSVASSPTARARSGLGSQGLSTRVLFQLAADGLVARGRPRGRWTSSQHRWAPITSWLPDGIEDLPTAEAQVDLVRRWLRAFGPGTVADIKWWTGWTMGETRKAIAGTGAVEVDLDGQTGLVLGDDLEPVSAPEPWVALLPPLDTTPMGWTERDWYLGDYRAPLFDRSGNIGPTVWCRRADRRRMGPAQGRRDRGAVVRGHRRRGGGRGRRRGGPARYVDRRRQGDAADSRRRSRRNSDEYCATRPSASPALLRIGTHVVRCSAWRLRSPRQ